MRGVGACGATPRCRTIRKTANVLARGALAPPEATLGSTLKAVVRVPHGCGAEAMHPLRIQIPEGFYNVNPMPHAGWTLQTVIGPMQRFTTATARS